MYTNEKEIVAFITYLKCSKNLAPKTLGSYLSDLRLFHRYERDNEDCGILQYISHLIQTGHKTSTIKRYLFSLTQYFKYVYRNNRPLNPMNELEIKLKSEKILPKTLTLCEMKRLFGSLYRRLNQAKTEFQNFQATRDLALIDVISSTGIRIGEAAVMSLQDIDLHTRLILIHGKGRKERIVYLSCQETVDNLKQWLQVRHKRNPASNFLFLNRDLNPISVHGIEDIFKKYCRTAKINPSATPHYLRHTFATFLLSNGSDIRSVQELLGHSNIAITERYTEVTSNHKIRVLKKYNYRNALLK